MIRTVKQVCRFNPVIRNYRMSRGIENLLELISDEGDGREFFARNYVTHGMEQLFREGLLRLSGKSDQAVFELNQAMGGGKTHLMIALGLLARHPHLRPEVLPIEQLEIERIPVAVRNWLALRPEERWWLFGMTAMVTGGIADAGRGWRIALQHALGDIAQSEQLLTRSRPSRSLSVEKDRATLDLFGAEAGSGSGPVAED
ncbi:MAG: hypothetical protein RIR86_1545 [Acidobacteriota bacterium]|jgi:hypothetical protein